MKKTQFNRPKAVDEMPDEILTVDEVCKITKLSDKTVRRLLVTGVIPGKRLGSQWRVPRTAMLDSTAGR